MDPISQTAGQVHFINRAVSNGLSLVAENRKLVIDYEEFCVGPEAVYEALVSQLGIVSSGYSGPRFFKPSRNVEADLALKIKKSFESFGWNGTRGN